MNDTKVKTGTILCGPFIKFIGIWNPESQFHGFPAAQFSWMIEIDGEHRPRLYEWTEPFEEDRFTHQQVSTCLRVAEDSLKKKLEQGHSWTEETP